MTQTAPAEFRDFSGGFTDYYLDGPMEKCRRNKNFLLVKQGALGKLRTRPGSTHFDPDATQIPAGAQRVGTLRYLGTTLFAHSARKLYYVDSGAFSTLQGPSSNDLWPAGIDTTHVMTTATWRDMTYLTTSALQRPQKVYQDSGGTWQLRTAGLPAPSGTISASHGTAGSTYLYTYRVLYKVEYTVGTVTYIDRGAFNEKAASGNTAIASGAGNTMTLSSIAALANGATDNWDTGNIVKEIYRTVAGGSSFFKVAEITNATTSYADTMTDATLVDQEPLYTEGGVVENDPAPLAKLCHVVGDVMLYGHVQDGSEIHKGRVVQSVPGDPDAVPGDFSCDADGELVGLSSFRGTPIMLCAQGAWRIDGLFDELGRGAMIPTRISDTASCIGAASVVQTHDGVFWWGETAVYWSDGQQVLELNDDWKDTHRALVATAEQRRRIVGSYDARNRRVYWTVQTTEATDCDEIVVLDLNFGVRPQATFTTLGGASFSPSAITFVDGDLVRGHKSGYVFRHDDDLYTDPRVDTAVAVADWGTEAVIFDYESCASSFGSNFERKYIPRVSVQAKNESNLSLQMISLNDDGRREDELKPVRYRGNLTWGDSSFVWGDSGFTWGEAGFIEEWRRFPAGSLRCSYKALRLTNAFVVIHTSDVFGTVDVNSTTKVATLTDAAAADIPGDLLDYVISFENDWTREFEITAHTADTVTFADTDNVSQTLSGQAWEIRGQPKNEAFWLLSFTFHFAQYGKTQDKYTSSETGSVAE